MHARSLRVACCSTRTSRRLPRWIGSRSTSGPERSWKHRAWAALRVLCLLADGRRPACLEKKHSTRPCQSSARRSSAHQGVRDAIVMAVGRQCGKRLRRISSHREAQITTVLDDFLFRAMVKPAAFCIAIASLISKWRIEWTRRPLRPQRAATRDFGSTARFDLTGALRVNGAHSFCVITRYPQR
jgi:hypothetical protein